MKASLKDIRMNLENNITQILRLKILNFALQRIRAYATIRINSKYRGCLFLYPHI